MEDLDTANLRNRSYRCPEAMEKMLIVSFTGTSSFSSESCFSFFFFFFSSFFAAPLMKLRETSRYV